MSQNHHETAATVLRYKEGMIRLLPKFLFGQEMAEKLVNKITRLYYRLVRAELPYDKIFLARCERVYALFDRWSKWTPVEWISQQETIRKNMEAEYKACGKKCSPMNEHQIMMWREAVFICVKRAARPRTRNLEKERGGLQLCIDAMYELIQLSQGSLHPEITLKLSEYRDYLINLCFKTSLFPKPFILDVNAVKMSNREPVESGASATVHHGFLGHEEVAVKHFRLWVNRLKRVKKRFVKEAFVLQLLRHPNVVPFVGVTQTETQLRIVSLWMVNGTVKAYLQNAPHASRKELIEQCADGLHFLHSNNIVHGDLKGNNILITSAGKACISDVGSSIIQTQYVLDNPLVPPLGPDEGRVQLARCRIALAVASLPQSLASTLSSAISTFSGAGTTPWMSPERLNPEVYNRSSASPTFESDVYAFGMLISEIYSGHIPYHTYGHNAAHVVLVIMAGLRPERSNNMNDEVWELTQSCWEAQSGRRPSIWDVYNVLAGMD